MNLLINIASKGRPRKLFNLMDNVESTISGAMPYEIIVKIDEDDTSYNGYCFTQNLIRVPKNNKIFATNYGIDQAKSNWDIVLNVSDDQAFVKPNWDVTMVKLIRSVWPTGTDFYAHFNDSFVKHRLATMDIKGREYYNRDGYIYHPSYKSVSCDAENMFVAMMRGRHHYFNEVLFQHRHPANTRSVLPDETYKGNHKYDKEDTDNYFARMKENFFVEGDLQKVMSKFK